MFYFITNKNNLQSWFNSLSIIISGVGFFWISGLHLSWSFSNHVSIIICIIYSPPQGDHWLSTWGWQVAVTCCWYKSALLCPPVDWDHLLSVIKYNHKNQDKQEHGFSIITNQRNDKRSFRETRISTTHSTQQ